MSDQVILEHLTEATFIVRSASDETLKHAAKVGKIADALNVQLISYATEVIDFGDYIETTVKVKRCL